MAKLYRCNWKQLPIPKEEFNADVKLYVCANDVLNLVAGLEGSLVTEKMYSSCVELGFKLSKVCFLA
jgi:hypothetical protein